jgi:hypothetical protein
MSKAPALWWIISVWVALIWGLLPVDNAKIIPLVQPSAPQARNEVEDFAQNTNWRSGMGRLCASWI